MGAAEPSWGATQPLPSVAVCPVYIRSTAASSSRCAQAGGPGKCCLFFDTALQLGTDLSMGELLPGHQGQG